MFVLPVLFVILHEHTDICNLNSLEDAFRMVVRIDNVSIGNGIFPTLK